MSQPPTLPLRARLEHSLNPVLERANRLPRPLVFLAVLGLLVAGVFVPGVGFVFSGLVALLVAGLVYLTWPRLTTPEKLMRLAVLAIIVAVTLVQIFPR